MTNPSFYGANIQVHPTQERSDYVNGRAYVVFSVEDANYYVNRYPNAYVGLRLWPDDGLFSKPPDQWTVSPEDRIQYFIDRGLDKRIWIIPTNEEADSVWQVEASIRMAIYANERGYKCMMGNYGPGGPMAVKVENGITVPDWDGHLAPLIEYHLAHREETLLNLHSYIFHFDLDYLADLENKIWWFAGRQVYLANKHPNVRIFLGETGCDDIDWRYHGAFGSPYGEPKEILTSYEYVQLLIEAYHKWWNRPQFVGGALFAYPHPDSWHTFDLFKINDDDIKELADMTRITGTAQIFEPPLKIALQVNTSSLNIRSAPLVSADTWLGKIDRGIHSPLYLYETTVQSNLLWAFVEFPDNEKAWIALEDVGRFTYAEYTEIEDDKPDLEDVITVILDMNSTLDELRARVTALENAQLPSEDTVSELQREVLVLQEQINRVAQGYSDVADVHKHLATWLISGLPEAVVGENEE
jgi:hypothetical protein